MENRSAKFKFYRRTLLQPAERTQQYRTVFAPGKTDQNPVARIDHPVFGYCRACTAPDLIPYITHNYTKKPPRIQGG